MKIIYDPLLQFRIRQDGYVDNGSNRGFQKGYKNKSNYFNIWSLKTNRNHHVHRIIGTTFVPKFSPDFNVIDHIDGGGRKSQLEPSLDHPKTEHDKRKVGA